MCRKVLWVDDYPLNNEAPVQVLKALQATVTQVKTTRQALAQLQVRRFDAIISDMGRWEGAQEGLVLLDRVRGMGVSTPFFIFSVRSGEPANAARAFARGAQGWTSSVDELLDMLRPVLFPAGAAGPP